MNRYLAAAASLVPAIAAAQTAKPAPADAVEEVVVTGLRQSIQTSQEIKQNAEVIVELSPSFEIRSRRLSDGFWQVHGEMERQGLLKHSRGQCPYRNGVSILEWLPEYGWREHKPTSAQ